MSSYSSFSSFAARARKLAALFAILIAPSILAGQNADIASPDDQALGKIDAFRAYDESGFSYDFRTIGDDGQSSLMRVSVRLEGENAALVRYREPAKQRGQAVLVRGNAFWLYEPGMKNALRISPRQILFGQASAGDVSRIDFHSMYAVMERGESEGLLTFKLKAKAGANATYDLIDLFTTADFRPVKAFCKGKSGTLMKTIRYGKYERIEGKELLTEYTLVDEINKKSELMRMSNFDHAVPPLSDFSIQALRFLK
jgi:outer membrane lipoprotein-sorting protein